MVFQKKFAGAISIAINIIIAMIMLGCSNTATTPMDISIDSRFSEFYNLMGGENTLGKAIGPIFNNGGLLLQYTENALMVYDETLPAGERYNFEALGNSFQIADPPLPAPENQPEVRYLNGHVIFADFVSLYDQLGGVRFVGKPLTEVRLNTNKSRYEQYFEKVGFYQNIGANNTTYLMPYGLIACRKTHPDLGCVSTISDAQIELTQYLPQPFLPIVQRLGENFTGAPLSQPYLAPDGYLEQIYENVILSIDPNNLRSAGLRNLPARVNTPTQPPVAPRNDPLLAFLLTDPNNNLGYNVPTPFLEYIATHGGNELAGPPISELFEVNGIRRQCFTNYCLDYDPSAPEQARIRPASLGYQYLNMQYYTTPKFNILVWEANPTVRQGEEQVVGAKVYNGTPDQPVRDVQPTLQTTLPNGETQTLTFPPTSTSGTTYLRVNLPAAKTGATIVYKVCVSQPGSDPFCVTESWLVR